jgi:hypothetical protein
MTHWRPNQTATTRLKLRAGWFCSRLAHAAVAWLRRLPTPWKSPAKTGNRNAFGTRVCQQTDAPNSTFRSLRLPERASETLSARQPHKLQPC